MDLSLYKDIIKNNHAQTLINKQLNNNDDLLLNFLSEFASEINTVLNKTSDAITALHQCVVERWSFLPTGWEAHKDNSEPGGSFLEFTIAANESDFFADVGVRMGPTIGLNIGIVVSNEWWDLKTAGICGCTFGDNSWKKFINTSCYRQQFETDDIKITIETPISYFELGQLEERRTYGIGSVEVMGGISLFPGMN